MKAKHKTKSVWRSNVSHELFFYLFVHFLRRFRSVHTAQALNMKCAHLAVIYTYIYKHPSHCCTIYSVFLLIIIIILILLFFHVAHTGAYTPHAACINKIIHYHMYYCTVYGIHLQLWFIFDASMVHVNVKKYIL